MSLVTRRYLAGVLLAGVCLALAGCGDGKGALTGKVSVQGKPLAGGTVMVQNPGGEVVVGQITDGSYRVEGVMAGSVKLAVIPGAAAAPGAEFDRVKMRDPKNVGRDRANRELAQVAAGPQVAKEYQALETTTLRHDAASSMTFDIVIP